MPRHTLTNDERRKGGWQRARQLAASRKNNPHKAEREVRNSLKELGFEFEPEYEIKSEKYPQWVDIMILDPKIAIEVDGSNGWHGDYADTKMWEYDAEKAKTLETLGIPLVKIDKRNTDVESVKKLLADCLANVEQPQTSEIPF